MVCRRTVWVSMIPAATAVLGRLRWAPAKGFRVLVGLIVAVLPLSPRASGLHPPGPLIAPCGATQPFSGARNKTRKQEQPHTILRHTHSPQCERLGLEEAPSVPVAVG